MPRPHVRAAIGYWRCRRLSDEEGSLRGLRVAAASDRRPPSSASLPDPSRGRRLVLREQTPSSQQLHGPEQRANATREESSEITQADLSRLGSWISGSREVHSHLLGLRTAPRGTVMECS